MELCDLLVKNKEFPNYQAERRMDLFVNFFLKDIYAALNDGIEIEFVAPEFPLKNNENNRSTKVDYLYIKKTPKQAEKTLIFVELKTDTKSFDDKQCDRYLNAKWEKCWKDLTPISQNSIYKKKYDILQNSILSEKYHLDKDLDKVNIEVLYIIPSIEIGLKNKMDNNKSCLSAITFKDFNMPKIHKYFSKNPELNDVWKLINENLFQKII